MYRSQCIRVAVSGVKGSGREILKFLIQTFWDVALFQLVKGNIQQEKNCLHLRHRAVEE